MTISNEPSYAHRTVPAKVLLFACVGLALTGCKLLKSQNDKACDRAAELLATPEEDLRKWKASCVAELKDMKKNDAAKYACTTKCFAESREKNEAALCVAGCGQSAIAKGSNTKSEDESETYPVDSLTPSTLKAKVETVYQHRGYDISGEVANAAGWSATITIGRPSSHGEVHVYKVILLDVNGRSDGFNAIQKLKRGYSASEMRVGNRKALYVDCLFQRHVTESGTPRACGASDSLIGHFANDLVTL